MSLPASVLVEAPGQHGTWWRAREWIESILGPGNRAIRTRCDRDLRSARGLRRCSLMGSGGGGYPLMAINPIRLGEMQADPLHCLRPTCPSDSGVAAGRFLAAAGDRPLA